jgi:hypothetical protein
MVFLISVPPYNLLRISIKILIKRPKYRKDLTKIWNFFHKTSNIVIQREQGTGNREQEKLMFKNMRLK